MQHSTPPEALTAALVVTWKGRLIAERYGNGIDIRTPLEGWSMGKSITATLLGVLVKKGVYKLTEPAPIPNGKLPATHAPKSVSRIYFTCRVDYGSEPLRIRL